MLICRWFNLLFVLIIIIALGFLGLSCTKQIKEEPPVIELEPAPTAEEEVIEEPSEPEEEIVVEEQPVIDSYSVVKGECLWKIAERPEVYDNHWKWPLIYRANRDQISNPHLIFPDQNFKIPRDYDKSEESNAIKEAKATPPPKRK